MKLTILPLACLLASAPAFAQTLPEPGYRTLDVSPAPLSSGSYATLSSGDVFFFDGQSCDLYAHDGTHLSNLGTLPASTFTSFAIVDPTESFAVIGENSNGVLYQVDLGGGGLTPIATLDFNYDACFDLDPNYVWVSAATAGFGAGNDLVRVELATGATQFAAHVAGPSGPLDVDAAGDLYYVTLDPTFAPADGSDLLRFDRADLLGGLLLDESDATLVTDLLDGASSVAVDPIGGNVFVLEANFAAVEQPLIEIDPFTGQILDVAATSFTWPGNLEFVATGGAGTFHAYQPAGVELVLSDTDFGNLTLDRVRLAPARPTATLTGAGSGPAAMTLTFDGAEPNAAVLLFWGSIQDVRASELTFDLGFGAPFHSAFAMSDIRRQPLLTPTDSNGTAIFQYFDPGHLHGTLAFQAAVMSPTARLIGSTEHVAN